MNAELDPINRLSAQRHPRLLASAYEGVTRGADREWGHWRVSYFDKSVHFDNPEADAAYTNIYASMRALGKEGSRIDEEMRELQIRTQR